MLIVVKFKYVLTTTTTKMGDKKQIMCEHCFHIWPTSSPLVNVTCSSCGLKTKNTSKKEDDFKE